MQTGIIASGAGTSSTNSCELTRRRGRPTIPTVDSLGSRIRERRRELGLTIDQLSDLCGVDQGTISRIENGNMPNVAFRVLRRIAATLELSLDSLAEGALA